MHASAQSCENSTVPLLVVVFIVTCVYMYGYRHGLTHEDADLHSHRHIRTKHCRPSGRRQRLLVTEPTTIRDFLPELTCIGSPGSVVMLT
jgi:hypothetical protein